MHALEEEGNGVWRLIARPDHKIRLCANEVNDICNWTIPAEGSESFCVACRHNRLVPDASTDNGLRQWRAISQAQRHLFYSMLKWNLPRTTRDEDPEGGWFSIFWSMKFSRMAHSARHDRP